MSRFLWCFVPCFNMSFSAVTYVRIWLDVAKVLVPKISKFVIPVGLAALAYAYVYW